MTNGIAKATPEQLAKLMAIGIEETEEGLTATERIARDRNQVLRHYRNALETLKPDQIEDVKPEELARGVRALIEDRGYFEPTPQDHKDARNLTLSSTYLQDTFGRAKSSVVQDVIRLFKR